MKNHLKKIKPPKKDNTNNKGLSKEEFNELMSGLTDEELNQVCDWLLNPQRSS